MLEPKITLKEPDFLSVEKAKQLAEEYLIPFGLNLLMAILVFYIGRMVARIIVKAVDKLMTKSEMDESLRKFVTDLAYAMLMVVVVIAALDRLGVKTTAAVAVLGAAGLAIGLALQGSLGNFASGVMIILFKPYKVGDVISVAGHTGGVDAIKVFVTILVTPDNRQIAIPNGQITGGSIVNLTARGTRRIDLVAGIGYDDDIKLAKQTLEEILAADDRILKDPAPQVAVSELADSSVNFVVRPWVNSADYWDVMFDVTEAIKLTFDEKGISIPFPQRDVHMHEVKQNAA